MVPLITEIIVDQLPHIYPLIELKDNYHRFVIVITTETEAQILETTIGSVTEEIMTARPELRNRIGREWTREHYRNHKHEREQQFIKEKIKIVADLMKRRGHNHLIVAGSPKMFARLTEALPSHLKNKLLSTMANNPSNGLGPLLRNCILEFSNAENLESHDRVEILESAVLSNGLGITGFEESKEAILGGYADMLIIDQDFNSFEGREELVRLATKFNVQIETVNESDTLKRLGGVGCLLRYKPYKTESKLKI
jgi:stalled ribosome rescue protein Dom34